MVHGWVIPARLPIAGTLTDLPEPANTRPRRLTHDSQGVETCPPVRKGLFRALLTQLHPGGYGILLKSRGGKTSAGDLSTDSAMNRMPERGLIMPGESHENP